jgi:hypothetical protein
MSMYTDMYIIDIADTSIYILLYQVLELEGLYLVQKW